MAVTSLDGPVGLRWRSVNVTNNSRDQRKVIVLLATIPESQGGKRSAWAVRPLCGPDGRCPASLAEAIWDFQRFWKARDVFHNIDDVVDPGMHTLQKLNELAAASSPAPAAPDAATSTLPAKYAYLPRTLLATLRRSYDEKRADNVNLANAMGWPPARTARDMTFEAVLDRLQAQGLLTVMRAIHDRCIRTAGLWEKVHTIRQAWTYAAGNNVSEGMQWTCVDPSGALAILHASPNFCEDIYPMNLDHQTDSKGRRCVRDTFREIIPHAGEGLHVCVVTPAFRAQDRWGGEHDIHIDRHQITCRRWSALAASAVSAGASAAAGAAGPVAGVYVEGLERRAGAAMAGGIRTGLDSGLRAARTVINREVLPNVNLLPLEKPIAPLPQIRVERNSCVYLDLVQHAQDAIPYFLKKFGVEVKMEQLLASFGTLVQVANNDITRVHPRDVTRLFQNICPGMPAPIAEQAGAWFLRTMKEFRPGRARR